MRLRDLPLDEAEKVLFDIITINTTVTTNSVELQKKILSGEAISSDKKTIKAVAMDTEGNSYGWHRSIQLKYFSDHFKSAKTFVQKYF